MLCAWFALLADEEWEEVEDSSGSSEDLGAVEMEEESADTDNNNHAS
jgi:hypothetical protein